MGIVVGMGDEDVKRQRLQKGEYEGKQRNGYNSPRVVRSSYTRSGSDRGKPSAGQRDRSQVEGAPIKKRLETAHTALGAS